MTVLILILVFNLSYLNLRYFNQTSNVKNTLYFQLYKSGFEVFKNNKLLGVGNKNYRIETCNDSQKDNRYICTTHPHQIYFEFLSEHGLIGTLIIFGIFYKLIFSKILNTIRGTNYIKKGSLIYLILVNNLSTFNRLF